MIIPQYGVRRICIVLSIDCAAFKLSNKRVMDQSIRPAEGSKFLRQSSIQIMGNIWTMVWTGEHLFRDMDKDFPPDVDQVLFSVGPSSSDSRKP